MVVKNLTRSQADLLQCTMSAAGVGVAVVGAECRNSYTVNIAASMKTLRNNTLYINEMNYSGNKKLENSATVKYIIWNIPARKTCPYATAMCAANCYAVKAEYAYPSCRPYRERALAVSKQDNFVDRMIYTIVVECLVSKRYKHAEQIRYRIHESGDFYSQLYVDSWMKIIRACQPIKKLVFDCYSKSLVFFEKYNAVNGVFLQHKNLRFKASVWADTAPEQLDMIKKHGYKIYTADTAENIERILKADKSAKKCRCADCNTCGLCVALSGVNSIYCVIH